MQVLLATNKAKIRYYGNKLKQKEIFDFILKTIFEIENKQERKGTK